MSSFSSCTAHPTTEAIGRCKQCGKPFCGQCRVQGPTGNFCSEDCRKAHEAFLQRAKQLDDMKARGSVGKFVRNGITIAALILIVSAIAHYFGYAVPVIGGFLEGIVPRAD